MALIPPGNIIRELAELRRRFFSEYAEPSARAYFEFPVAEWLGEIPAGSALASFARSVRLPLEFGAWRIDGRDVFLELSAPLRSSFSAHGFRASADLEGAADARLPGPFAARIGMYCASLDSLPEGRIDSLMAELGKEPFPALRAETWLMALIELSWRPGSGRESSWAVLSSARAGVKGRNPENRP